MSKVIVGQQEVIDRLLLVLICGGHTLIEGVPGLAKTLAVKSLARICALGFQRVQCTADLMPADVTGTNVLDRKSTRLNSSHSQISYAVFCLKKKKINKYRYTQSTASSVTS